MNLNIDVPKLKKMAKKIKEELELLGKKISLMESYELVSKQIGFKNYNTALSLINKEICGKKNIDYTFYIKDKKIEKSLLLKINESIEKLYSLNKNFKHELFLYDHLIVLNLYFNPNDIAYEGMIIDVMLISYFKEDLIKNKLVVDKRDLLIRDEKTNINNSILNAIKINK